MYLNDDSREMDRMITDFLFHYFHDVGMLDFSNGLSYYVEPNIVKQPSGSWEVFLLIPLTERAVNQLFPYMIEIVRTKVELFIGCLFIHVLKHILHALEQRLFLIIVSSIQFSPDNCNRGLNIRMGTRVFRHIRNIQPSQTLKGFIDAETVNLRD